MVLLHVDDFLIGGEDKFVEEVTQIFKETLTVSKVKDDRFRYCSVDIELMKDKVVLSMENYTSSLEEVQIRKAKKPCNCQQRTKKLQ